MAFDFDENSTQWCGYDLKSVGQFHQRADNNNPVRFRKVKDHLMSVLSSFYLNSLCSYEVRTLVIFI